MGFGGSPSISAPPTPAPLPPVEDDEELARLARQRKSLEAKRSGRKNLRIELVRNPGVAAGNYGGLRIPE